MRVLIVEDDPMVRTINKGYLKKIDQSIEIVEANTIEAAKEILESRPINLILLDVYLGEGRGPDLLTWARASALDLEVVLITADNSYETVESVFRLGAIDYLIKPFSFERFSEAINKVKQKRSAFSEKVKVDQEDIDKMLSIRPKTVNEKTADQDHLAEKGINPMTYALVKEALINAGKKQTAQDIARATNLARVTVRRYLEHMVSSDEVLEELNYGKVGRPNKYYLWKE